MEWEKRGPKEDEELVFAQSRIQISQDEKSLERDDSYGWTISQLHFILPYCVFPMTELRNFSHSNMFFLRLLDVTCEIFGRMSTMH